MAVPELTKNQNNMNLSATEATAEVFLMAFNALPDESQQVILRRLLADIAVQKQPVAQVLAAIASERWTPPPGSPDSLLLLREDRAR
jgi:hypothetical protein